MLLEIRIYLSTSGVAGDSCFLVVLLEIRFYWWGFLRFLFSCGVAGDSYLLVGLLEIHVFLWCCWRFVSSDGFPGDSCLMGRHAMLTGK